MAMSRARILRDQNSRRKIGSSPLARKNIKGLVRDHQHTCNILGDSNRSNFNAATDSCDNFQSRNESNAFCVNDWQENVADSRTQSSAALRMQQSRIVDRWAAQQAREMITTIERQAYEAELLVLSSVQPVSARASSFLRETLPTQAESFLELPNLQASSLVQMWKEFEENVKRRMENRTSRKDLNHMAVECTNAASTADSISIGERSGSSEFSDSADEIHDSGADYESDQTGQTERQTSETGESERGRVSDMVRKLNSGSPKLSSSTMRNQLVLEQSLSGQRDNLGFCSNGKRCLIRGTQAIRDFLLLIIQERQRELDIIAERHAVSQFSHRSRIQALLRFRFLQREVAVQNQQHPTSTASELDLLKRRTPFSILRERFIPGGKKGDCSHPVFGESSSSHMKLPIISVDTRNSGSPEKFFNENIQILDIATKVQVGTLLMPNSLASSSEELQEETSLPNSPSVSEELQEEADEVRQSSDFIWQNRKVSTHNLDWDETMNTDRCLHSDWEGEAAIEESDPHPTFHHCWEGNNATVELLEEACQETMNTNTSLNGGWEGDAASEDPDANSLSHGGWEGNNMTDEPVPGTRQYVAGEHTNGTWSNVYSLPRSLRDEQNESTYQGRQEIVSDNEEIRQLLDRRHVSTALASDFRERMDELLLSHLHRLENHSIDDCQDRDCLQQNSSSMYQFPHHSLEMELLYELKGDIMQIHQEMLELRRSIESCSCINMQKQMQHPITQQDSASGPGQTLLSSMRKGTCCICYNMQVDSLLYRCGHMCTCFDCAHELQWSGGVCPICKAPIVDVVRSYSGN